MNKFEKQLEKWNHGVLRGAQAKLAKVLGVSTATTALWATGKRRPSKGYVSQMATLFGLDVYKVLKLFEPSPSTTYPLPTSNGQRMLRDEDAASRYLAPCEQSPWQSNSIALPFLNKPTADFSSYNEDDIIEWWYLPRRYAQGAKYIVRSRDIALEGAACEDDLCLIKPAQQLIAGQVMLFAKQQQYCTCRVVKAGKGYQYQSPSGKKYKLPDGFILIGLITKQIKPI